MTVPTISSKMVLAIESLTATPTAPPDAFAALLAGVVAPVPVTLPLIAVTPAAAGTSVSAPVTGMPAVSPTTGTPTAVPVTSAVPQAIQASDHALVNNPGVRADEQPFAAPALSSPPTPTPLPPTPLPPTPLPPTPLPPTPLPPTPLPPTPLPPTPLSANPLPAAPLPVTPLPVTPLPVTPAPMSAAPVVMPSQSEVTAAPSTPEEAVATLHPTAESPVPQNVRPTVQPPDATPLTAQATVLPLIGMQPTQPPASEPLAVTGPTRHVRPALFEAAKHLKTEGDRTSLVIRLDPPELGAVLVRLTVKHGQVDVQLRTPDLAARGDLQAQAFDVKQVLREQGLDLASFDVAHGDVLSSSGQNERETPDRATPRPRNNADGRSSTAHVMDDVPGPQPAGTWL